MLSDVKSAHYLNLVARLNVEHAWGLTSQMQQRYAQQVADYCSVGNEESDSQLCSILRNYHDDHTHVEALLNPNHPEHTELWNEWLRQALRILAAKTAGAQPPDAVVASREDLAQEAMSDLWRGLRTFRYQSRFQTWAFTVISNSLVRHYRAQQYLKRSAMIQTQSLDALLDIGDTFWDHINPSPDEVALGNTLAALSQQVLERHPDRRLTAIFRLWACEEQTLRSIGNQFNLSVSRIHILLTQAITLLRNEVTVQDWIGERMNLHGKSSAR